jgi:hypothetical protein
MVAREEREAVAVDGWRGGRRQEAEKTGSVFRFVLQNAECSVEDFPDSCNLLPAAISSTHQSRASVWHTG